MSIDLIRRQQGHFFLWRPAHTNPPPQLVIGRFQPGNPPALAGRRDFDLAPLPDFPDLWAVAAEQCGLADGLVYHYWFEVGDSRPGRVAGQRILVTDPAAPTVDWRLLSPPLPAPYTEEDRHAAGVILYKGGRLVPCDPGGELPDYAGDTPLRTRPASNRLVIYELPTAWARTGQAGAVEIDVGTFQDVRALVEKEAAPANFAGVEALAVGRALLQELGINALELLPPADCAFKREWGYDTANYFAPDFELGFPDGNSSPTAAADLAALVAACHRHGIRWFCDMVMAFATRYVCRHVNFLDFHVLPGSGDPEEYNQGQKRDGFGGDLFKYNLFVDGYDPVTGKALHLCPARQLMKAYLARWMEAFRVDGLRLDSIVNIGNWDFVQEFKELARDLWRDRWLAENPSAAGADERFLVVGEELAVPLGLVYQGRLDGLWNEPFLYRVRAAILGQSHGADPDFETTVRNMIDCRRVGFGDGTQAVNYVTSHDVEGWRKERLFRLLANNGISDVEDVKHRVKLAFACLLTAVGVPMFLAGEEFADDHDLPTTSPAKQTDPVNYDRLADPWRRDVFDAVARLVKLRTTSDALAVNETEFIHVDFTDGKRVLAWRRGRPGVDGPVVVLANFSDWRSDRHGAPPFEYRVANWPRTPAAKRWHEVTQDRDVPAEWVGREPIYPWEAKVYALV
jgi:1,4-alpha-glucan branching enzyme